MITNINKFKKHLIMENNGFDPSENMEDDDAYLAELDEQKAKARMEREKENGLDLTKDQHLMSIRKDGQELGHIEIVDGKITTSGIIGENTYDNFVELIKGLQGFDIEIDNFFW